MLIKKHEGVWVNKYNDSNQFIEYSSDMDKIYENIEEYNPDNEGKTLTLFNDMIAAMRSNKNLNLALAELFIKREN